MTNTSQVTTDRKIVLIKLIDKDGKELIQLHGSIIALEPNESAQLNVGVTADFSDAFDFEIEEVEV